MHSFQHYLLNVTNSVQKFSALARSLHYRTRGPCSSSFSSSSSYSSPSRIGMGLDSWFRFELQSENRSRVYHRGWVWGYAGGSVMTRSAFTRAYHDDTMRRKQHEQEQQLNQEQEKKQREEIQKIRLQSHSEDQELIEMIEIPFNHDLDMDMNGRGEVQVQVQDDNQRHLGNQFFNELDNQPYNHLDERINEEPDHEPDVGIDRQTNNGLEIDKIPLTQSQKQQQRSELKQKFNKYSTSASTRFELIEKDLEEKFIKGGGPGGQSVNKTSSCVVLRHVPTGITVRVQQERNLWKNRRIARRLLRERVECHFFGKKSTLELRYEKIRKRKARQRKRAKKKYGTKSSSSPHVDAQQYPLADQQQQDTENKPAKQL